MTTLKSFRPALRPPACSHALTQGEFRAGRTMLEALPYPIMLIDHDRRIEWANCSARSTYGKLEGFCFAATHKAAAPCDRQGEACPLRQAEKDGRPVSVTHLHTTRTGLELHQVIAVPRAEGGALEFQIPLVNLVGRDETTGLCSRFLLEQIIRRENALLERMQRPFALVFVDLDGFKHLNDERGHLAGDAALRAVGNAISRSLRAADTAGRWGGDEFCAFMPAADLTGGKILARRIHASIRAARLDSPWADVRLTASVGVFSAPGGCDLATAFDQVDRAMYKAKHSGRNCVATLPDFV